MEVDATSFLKQLADTLGSGESALRLVLSLLAGYPLAYVYRHFVYRNPPVVQHVFFILTGLAICYFNFGFDTIHSITNVVLIWLLLQICGGTKWSVAVGFVLNTGYLLMGYYVQGTDDYDISWATPHCVITLRLTGTIFDIYDGKKKVEHMSEEQKSSALYHCPSLLEMMGHVFYFGSFLTGPTFSMRRYLSFVTGEYGLGLGPPRNHYEAFSRLGAGVAYIAVFHILSFLVFTDQYMLSPQFNDLRFFSKCAYILIWGKLHLCKYVGVWLLGEGSCILTGLTYNGKDVNGNMLWDGCSNTKLYVLESASTFKEVIVGFNVCTNTWMARYIFKRLKFLGSVQASQSVTLLYLAVWHGLHSGYYMNFFLEFIMVNGETQLSSVLRLLPATSKILSLPVLSPLVWLVKKICMQFFLSYALVSFVHLKWHRYSQVYSSISYVGHVVFLVLPLFCVMVKSSLKTPGKSSINGVPTQKSKEESKKIK
ncbi:lysophospholipid acyltransferase 5-like [Dreissena polymorpha]|uniref:lysophospholipid acyltransferase 5-like n=1 Tax=Dreissena polymorpha TaxID=45954 RepID=UPI002263C308|nr:lysophospholipid acyltransferase 5-like [Dreissena polymorpha]XP_052286228.1 lysophospholipid acyltransferase 5-like [Dreissena polymorpha]XP_052286229.1 lysophospholipid acyltransferase 5-like [Dreissena polymorpha]XP_052286230.1 lysophospholipid acyltransferase 5-like [Dreissena polymorpha]XP_052286231.1 lysophospholipid acyltransferase 5-like [Dreissena polymorpha]XP_052286233.1 lysophospholipid acyltransferase 5-like [Dreissena polymorpha]XP_052286234.1 lysophospholipid acyltransferase